MAKLGDFMRIKHGFAFKGDYITAEDNEIVLVTPGNFEIGGGFKEKKCKFFSGDYPKDYVLHADDLIVTMTDLSKQGDTLGYSARVPNSNRIYLHNQRIGLVDVFNPNADKDYLYWFMRTPQYQKKIVATASGSTVKHTSPSRICDVEINLPSIDKQKKIASLLTSIEKKIHISERINDNLFAQMQALYAAWFIDCIPFGGIKPSSWQKTSIYTIADIIYGAPFSSKQFNTDEKGIPIIRIRDLKEQKVATYTTEKHPKGYLLQAGDIVVGMDGEFVPYIWGSDEAWLNQRVCVFKNKRLKGKAFLYFTIKPLLYAIEQTQVATTVIHIGKKDFDAFEITLPDPRVLDSFDAITTPMVEKIVENRFEIKQLELLRDALLPKLMSGELDVSNIQL
jgi:type I restriction enzyme, S subunit